MRRFRTGGASEVTTTRRENACLDLDRLKHALDHFTILVSVMLVNNEILVRSRTSTLALCAARDHSVDAAPGYAGRICPPRYTDLDELAPHKTYGPKGTEATPTQLQAVRGRWLAAASRAVACARHAAHAPDRRQAGEAPHRAAPRWAPERERIPHCRSAACLTGLQAIEQVLHQRRPSSAGRPTSTSSFNFARGRVAHHGREGHRAVSSGSACLLASLEPMCVARIWPQRRTYASSPARPSAASPPRPEIDSAGQDPAGPGGQVARTLAAVGDVQRRRRHQFHPVGAH